MWRILAYLSLVSGRTKMIFVNLAALGNPVVFFGAAILAWGNAGCCLDAVQEIVLRDVLELCVADEAHHEG